MKFNIVRAKPEAAAEKWKAQNCKGGAWSPRVTFGDTKDVYERLVALGPTPTWQSVEAVARSWGGLWCSCCHSYVGIVVELYVDDPTGICFDCLDVMRYALHRKMHESE